MKFADIVGQDELKDHLLYIVKKGNVPHAQLFLSTAGTGALPLALAFAQYLVCTNKQEKDSCGQCNECIKSQKLIHPDIHYTYPIVPKKSGKPSLSTDYITEWRKAITTNAYLDVETWLQLIDAENKQGNISADEARKIISNLSLKSYESEYKIHIIWLAEALGKEGNILLKLLEEPTDKTILILISENQDAILPTVISRCQILKINRISEEEIETALIKKGIPKSKAQQVAFLANGNLMHAFQIAEKEIDDITYTLISWMKCITSFDVNAMLKWIDEQAKSGREKIKSFFEYTEHVFRETMLQQYQTNYKPKLNDEELKIAKALHKYFQHYHQIQEIVRLLDKKYYEVERNVNAKVLLMSTTLKMYQLLNKR